MEKMITDGFNRYYQSRIKYFDSVGQIIQMDLIDTI